MTTLILFCTCCFIIYRAFRLIKVSVIKSRWEGAFRHIVVLILAWSAMAAMASLIILLDLFERGHYSIGNLLHALRMPWLLLTAGLSIVLIALWAFITRMRDDRVIHS